MKKYKVLIFLKIKCGERIREFRPGTLLKFTDADASRMLQKGFIEPVKENKCKRCGATVRLRFMYNAQYCHNESKCDWFCIVCEPYHFN